MQMISFTTNERAMTGGDGTIEYVPWIAKCGDYKTDISGINHPTTFQAIWKYPDEEFVYFDGYISEIEYGF